MMTVSAPGKIHISGEHSVVYGKPALLAAVDKRIRVTITPLNDNTIKYKDINSGKQTVSHFAEIQQRTLETKSVFAKASSDRRFGVFRQSEKNPWTLHKIAIGETYQFLNRKPKSGFSLSLYSEIPIGSGMGSSAATSAAIIGAIFCLEQETWDLQTINKIVYEAEKRVHGLPSGADNTTIVHGGLLRFPSKTVTPPGTIPPFILIQSGKPIETTGEMVANVRAKYNEKKETFKALFSQTEAITEQIIKAFETSAFENFYSLIQENQRLLEKMGVVSERAKRIIRRVESIGGAAKICGAGGKKKGSGIILAFHPQIKMLEQALKKEQIPYFCSSLTNKGLIREDI